MESLRVFISGPYTAPTLADVEANVHRAIEAGVDVIRANHLPIVPHVMGHYLHDAHTRLTRTVLSYEFWMEFCKRELATCDAVYRIGDSPGVRIECAHAALLGIPIVRDTALLDGIAARRAS